MVPELYCVVLCSTEYICVVQTTRNILLFYFYLKKFKDNLLFICKQMHFFSNVIFSICIHLLGKKKEVWMGDFQFTNRWLEMRCLERVAA